MARRAENRKKCLVLVLTLALLLPLLGGCAPQARKMETTIFAMDTVMNLTFYGTDPEAALKGVQDELVAELHSLESKLSSVDGDSEIYALNEQGHADLSPETAEVLTQALALCAATGGALDITAYPAVKAAGIDYTLLEVDPRGGTADLAPGAAVDLGAVAKGYAGDRLAEMLRQTGIGSALLDLGQSTIQTVGVKPDGSPWRIGLQDPAGDGYLGVLELEEGAVGTSGGYQRYFEEDGVRYWHIMDPDTAAPARSGLASATVVGASGLICDGLSTALFVMGLEESAQFWREHPELGVELILGGDDGRIYVSGGLEGRFTLSEDHADREVTVLE